MASTIRRVHTTCETRMGCLVWTSSSHLGNRHRGLKKLDGSYSCAWPDCKSRARLVCACDSRKHYRRQLKLFLCRYHGCPKSTKNGFSTKRDRARHEAKHNPSITCEWRDCDRLFSRVDNMVRCPLLNLKVWHQHKIEFTLIPSNVQKEHVQRVHKQCEVSCGLIGRQEKFITPGAQRQQTV